MSEAPPIDAWLAELGLEVVGSTVTPDGAALSRDVILDGERRFDLRVTVAWVSGMGCSLWAYYGPEEIEIPRRTLLGILRANFEYPFVKFALTDDDRPMLMTELHGPGLTRDELARGLVRLVLVADRLLEATAPAVAVRGILPDWSGRIGRNPELLAAHRAEVEALMPHWAPATEPQRPRRGLLAWLFGTGR